MIWWATFAAAALALLLHFRTRNAVWGAATLGALVGIGAAIIRLGFDWLLVAKIAAISTLLGVAIEWLPRLGKNPRNA